MFLYLLGCLLALLGYLKLTRLVDVGKSIPCLSFSTPLDGMTPVGDCHHSRLFTSSFLVTSLIGMPISRTVDLVNTHIVC
jgi:hypothetical protein